MATNWERLLQKLPPKSKGLKKKKQKALGKERLKDGSKPSPQQQHLWKQRRKLKPTASVGSSQQRNTKSAASPPAATSAAAASAAGSNTLAPSNLPLGRFCANCELLTEHLALDCEMVGIGAGGVRSALAQVVVINSREELVYSAYVRPSERITDYRTRVSGVRPQHMARAIPFSQAQVEISKILYQRVLVGHALHNDLKVCVHFRHLPTLTQIASRPPNFPPRVVCAHETGLSRSI